AGHRLSRVQAPLDEVFRPPASTRWNLYSLRMRIQVPAPFGSRPRGRERARVRKETRMRIGLMIGPERGRYRHKVAQLIADAEAAEEAGFTSIWVPQIPGDFDAFTAIALMAQATERIELGTAVVPIQTRHPIAMAQEALSNQAVCEGRFTLGLG